MKVLVIKACSYKQMFKMNSVEHNELKMIMIKYNTNNDEVFKKQKKLKGC